MSKRHQASRRRSYGRREHEMHERVDRGAGPSSWLDDADLAVAIRFDRERDHAAGGWTRLRGLD